MYEFSFGSKDNDWRRGRTHRGGDKSSLSTPGSPDVELTPLWDVAHNTRRNDARSTAGTLARDLSLMPSEERASSLLSLQRTRGNRYVQGLIVQARLSIGHAGDRYEQEAERAAGQVMSMPGPHPGHRFHPGERIQGMASVPEELIIRSAGEPLPQSLRSFFEPRFGQDFSRVRVHTGAGAAQLAGSFDAQAFTVGQNIVFDSGRYAPKTATGRRLIAHELTHVVQQEGRMRAVQKQENALATAGSRAGVASPPAFRVVIVEVPMRGLTDAVREKVRSRVQSELRQITSASKRPRVRSGFEVSLRRSLSGAEAKAFGKADFVVYLIRKGNPQGALDLARRHVAIEKGDEKKVAQKLAAQLKAEGGACLISGSQNVSFVDIDLFERLSLGIFSAEERALMDGKIGEHLAELVLHELGHAMGQKEGEGLMGAVEIEANRPTRTRHFTQKSKGEMLKNIEPLGHSK